MHLDSRVRVYRNIILLITGPAGTRQRRQGRFDTTFNHHNMAA